MEKAAAGSASAAGLILANTQGKLDLVIRR
jgi:hypothetical protein